MFKKYILKENIQFREIANYANSQALEVVSFIETGTPGEVDLLLRETSEVREVKEVKKPAKKTGKKTTKKG